MLGSPLLGTAVGLVLLFAMTSLLCSGITEWLSNVLQLRAKYLLTGMRAMLDAPESAEKPGRKERGDTLHERVKKPASTEQAAIDVRDVMAKRKPESALSGAAMTTALWDSPLLTSLQSRRVGVFRKGRLRNPQYVSGRTFARALIDLLVPSDPDGAPPVVVKLEEIRSAVEKLPAVVPLRKPLLVFLAQAGGEVEVFERSVEQWYDEQMAKINGWYKRWARVMLGVVGLAVALFLNIDTLQVARALYVDAPLQQAVAATASTGTLCQNAADAAARDDCVMSELADLQASGVPVGYSTTCGAAAPDRMACLPWSGVTLGNVLLKLLGWAVTAFAVSFGAPFWFDALSKLGSLRNAGTKPAPTS